MESTRPPNELDVPGWGTTDRRSGARRGRWYRRVTPERAVAVITIATVLGGTLGLRVASDGRDAKAAVAVTNARVEEVAARIARVEDSVRADNRRVDSLANRLELTNYMQCVQLRKTDPAALPRDCAPIFESRRHP